MPRISIWDPKALTEALAVLATEGQALADAVAWRWSPAGLLALAVEYGGEAPADGGAIAPPAPARCSRLARRRSMSAAPHSARISRADPAAMRCWCHRC